VIVDVDEWFILWALIYEATKDRASRYPLAGEGEVVKLGVSSWDLDNHVLTTLGLSTSGVERVVEAGQDLGVTASADIGPDSEHHRTNGGTVVRDDGALARAIYRDIRERGDVRASLAHPCLLAVRAGWRDLAPACFLVLEDPDAGQIKVAEDPARLGGAIERRTRPCHRAPTLS
jgi:hypothetical protein